MNWGSPAEFFSMGGYGLYVWGAYAVCLAAMLIEPWLARRHRLEALVAASTHREGFTMKPRHKRLALIGGIVAAVGVATALVLNAFQSNLVFFYSPSQVAPRRRR